MTTYKQMKHALLSNNTIEMYKPTVYENSMPKTGRQGRNG